MTDIVSRDGGLPLEYVFNYSLNSVCIIYDKEYIY